MSDELEIRKVEGYLHITFSGAFSQTAVTDSVDAMVAACAKEDCAKVLFDCRPMKGEMSILDRYAAAQYGALKIPHALKIAMLGREDQILPDRFFETAARNRNLNVTVFSDVNKAVEWLKN